MGRDNPSHLPSRKREGDTALFRTMARGKREKREKKRLAFFISFSFLTAKKKKKGTRSAT